MNTLTRNKSLSNSLRAIQKKQKGNDYYKSRTAIINPVYVFDTNGKLVKTYNTRKELEDDTKIKISTVKWYMGKGKKYGDFYYSTNINFYMTFDI